MLRGRGLLMPKTAPTDWDWHWRQNFGKPAVQRDPPPRGRVVELESEASYLRRLGLFAPGEEARVPDWHFTARQIFDPWHPPPEEE